MVCLSFKGDVYPIENTEDGVIPAHLDLSGWFRDRHGRFQKNDPRARRVAALGGSGCERCTYSVGAGQNEFGDFRLRGLTGRWGIKVHEAVFETSAPSSDEDESDDGWTRTEETKSIDHRGRGLHVTECA